MPFATLVRPVFAGILRLGFASVGTGLLSAGHAPPNACTVVTVAQVSTAIGKPVTGGTISIYDNPKSNSASCQYTAPPLSVMVMLSQFDTPAAAQQAFSEELKNTRNADGDSQKTVDETGVGDQAYSFTMTTGMEMETITAVKGTRKISVVVMGKGSTGVPHGQIRTLMLAALAH